MKQKVLVLAAGLLLVSLAAFGAFASKDASGAGSDVHGIPDSNPVFQPTDGHCDKHESDIKITPSGNRVNVPCHVVDKGH